MSHNSVTSLKLQTTTLLNPSDNKSISSLVHIEDEKNSRYRSTWSSGRTLQKTYLASLFRKAILIHVLVHSQRITPMASACFRSTVQYSVRHKHHIFIFCKFWAPTIDAIGWGTKMWRYKWDLCKLQERRKENKFKKLVRDTSMMNQWQLWPQDKHAKKLTLVQSNVYQATELCGKSYDDLPMNSMLHVPSMILPSSTHTILNTTDWQE